DGAGSLVGILTIEALVSEVGEEDRLAMDPIAAAAIFVDQCPHVVALGRHVADRAIGTAADDHRASRLHRATLGPEDGIAGDLGLPQPDAAGSDQLRTNR